MSFALPFFDHRRGQADGDLEGGRNTLRKRTPAPRALRPFSRRQFLKASGMAAVLANLPTGWTGRVFASDAPEKPKLTIGIIPLTDCAQIVVAHEKGFFKEEGLDVMVAKEISWAAIRDKVS